MENGKWKKNIRYILIFFKKMNKKQENLFTKTSNLSFCIYLFIIIILLYIDSSNSNEPDNLYYYGYYDNKIQNNKEKNDYEIINNEKYMLRPKPIDFNEIFPNDSKDDLKWEKRINRLNKKRPSSAINSLWRETVFNKYKDNNDDDLNKLKSIIVDKENDYYDKHQITIDELYESYSYCFDKTCKYISVHFTERAKFLLDIWNNQSNIYHYYKYNYEDLQIKYNNMIDKKYFILIFSKKEHNQLIMSYEERINQLNTIVKELKYQLKEYRNNLNISPSEHIEKISKYKESGATNYLNGLLTEMKSILPNENIINKTKNNISEEDYNQEYLNESIINIFSCITCFKYYI